MLFLGEGRYVEVMVKGREGEFHSKDRAEERGMRRGGERYLKGEREKGG